LARPAPHFLRTGRERFDACHRSHVGATLLLSNAIDGSWETAAWSFLQLARKNCSSRRTRFRA
jgi:hypothetical protein